MTTANLATLDLIVKHNIRLSPVLSKKGNVDFWQAGFVQVSPVTGQNYVNTTDFAHGVSPQEAVENLLVGKTVY